VYEASGARGGLETSAAVFTSKRAFQRWYSRRKRSSGGGDSLDRRKREELVKMWSLRMVYAGARERDGDRCRRVPLNERSSTMSGTLETDEVGGRLQEEEEGGARKQDDNESTRVRL
jgi:hypothetical protein